MKSILSIFVFAVMTISSNVVYGQSKTDSLTGPQTLQIKTSAVCDMCKETLEKAMAYEKGVKESNLDVDSKMLKVVFDPKKTTPEKIRLAVSKTGYDADSIPADPKAYEQLNPCCKKDAVH